MKLYAALTTLAVATAAPAHDSIAEYSFFDFVDEYEREYPTEEMFMRRDIFEANKKMIVEHNAKKLSWTMNVNHFADRTPEEMKAMKGFNKAMHQDRMKDMPTATAEDLPNFGSYPKSIDWRTKGVVSPVKNQGACGSCWAFAATETMESYLAIKTGKITELAVQQVVSCTKNPNHCGGTGGCGGATAELGIGFAHTNGGLASAADYPYTSGGGDSGECQPNHPPVATFTGFVKLPSNNFTAVMSALGNTGPLAITVDASKWSFYSGGVYTPQTYSTLDLDHGVQAVGYGTDSGTDYWIVRNSWGESWGESGFIRIKRNDGTSQYCGVDSSPGDGTACTGGPSSITACGTDGILYDTCFATGAAPASGN
jgi:cathepsin L